jgi:hypothetical protein
MSYHYSIFFRHDRDRDDLLMRLQLQKPIPQPPLHLTNVKLLVLQPVNWSALKVRQLCSEALVVEDQQPLQPLPREASSESVVREREGAVVVHAFVALIKLNQLINLTLSNKTSLTIKFIIFKS